MLLRMYCKNADGKKILKTGRMMLGSGLVFNAIGIILSRYDHTNLFSDFFNGLFIGLGLVLMISAIMFIKDGENKIRNNE